MIVTDFSFKTIRTYWMWCLTPIISAAGRQEQADPKFKIILDTPARPCFKFIE